MYKADGDWETGDDYVNYETQDTKRRTSYKQLGLLDNTVDDRQALAQEPLSREHPQTSATESSSAWNRSWDKPTQQPAQQPVSSPAPLAASTLSISPEAQSIPGTYGTQLKSLGGGSFGERLRRQQQQAEAEVPPDSSASHGQREEDNETDSIKPSENTNASLIKPSWARSQTEKDQRPTNTSDRPSWAKSQAGSSSKPSWVKEQPSTTSSSSNKPSWVKDRRDSSTASSKPSWVKDGPETNSGSRPSWARDERAINSVTKPSWIKDTSDMAPGPNIPRSKELYASEQPSPAKTVNITHSSDSGPDPVSLSGPTWGRPRGSSRGSDPPPAGQRPNWTRSNVSSEDSSPSGTSKLNPPSVPSVSPTKEASSVTAQTKRPSGGGGGSFGEQLFARQLAANAAPVTHPPTTFTEETVSAGPEKPLVKPGSVDHPKDEPRRSSWKAKESLTLLQEAVKDKFYEDSPLFRELPDKIQTAVLTILQGSGRE